MSRSSRLITGIGIAVLLAACGQGGTDTPLSPSTVHPRMDSGGGGVIVNGNATGGSGSTTSANTASSGDSTSVGDTGGVIVNGN